MSGIGQSSISACGWATSLTPFVEKTILSTQNCFCIPVKKSNDYISMHIFLGFIFFFIDLCINSFVDTILSKLL